MSALENLEENVTHIQQRGVDAVINEPLVPAECDLSDFKYMPLDTERLLSSDFSAEVDPASGFFAIQLWAASWHQKPAGSLPSNSKILAKLAGLGRDFSYLDSNKEDILYGWIKCSDGRYYHPTISQKVLEAWTDKLFQRVRSSRANSKRYNNQYDHNELSNQLNTAFKMLQAASPDCKRVQVGIPQEFLLGTLVGGSDISYKESNEDSYETPKESKVKLSKVTKDKDNNFVEETEGGLKTQENKFSEEDRATAKFIYLKILEINPKFKKPNPEKWADCIRLMRQRDERTHDEIKNLYAWVSNDSFWRTVVLSPAKLRDQWDALTTKKVASGNNSGGASSGVDDNWIEEVDEFACGLEEESSNA